MVVMELSDSIRDALESHPNVIGTCLGKRRVGGKETDEESVIVLVSQKVPSKQLSAEDLVPETVEIDGQEVPTDVQEIGEPRAHAAGGAVEPVVESDTERTRRWRPAPAGVSVGHPEITAGTLGSPVLRDTDDRPVVLTNAHVGAPIGAASRGDPVYQPGPADGGTDADTIGELREYSEITRTEPNTSDSALIAVDPDAIAEDVLGIGSLVGIDASPDRNATYTKSGRTTGVTTGGQRGRDARVQVQGYYDEPVVFEGVTVFDPMSASGDSGSLIGIHTEGGFQATHLLFAGSDRATLAVPMAAVQEEHGPLTPAPETEPQAMFHDQVRRALTNGYGPAAINEPETGPDFLVTTPFVRLVVVVSDTGAAFEAAGRALALSTQETDVPMVVCPDTESDGDGALEALGRSVCLVRL